MTEIWKPVVDYENLYEVSNAGKVRNIQTGKVLTGRVNNRGYERVCLIAGDSRKEFLVHRLVALAFIPKIPGKDLVNHIDENKRNNHADNLEWVTQHENITHSVDRLRVPKKHKDITLYTVYGKFVQSFSSVAEASQFLGVEAGTVIYAIKRGSVFNTMYYLGTADYTPNFWKKSSLVDYLEDYRTAERMKKSALAKILGQTLSNYRIWLQRAKVPYKELKKVSVLLGMTLDEVWELNEQQ